jgi:hypothetical protein
MQERTTSITVGRLPDNDVVIAFDMVSGHHARLEREGNRVFLVDLGSRNGTSVNDPLNKISRAPIQAGDVVFLGTHKVMARDLLAALPADMPEATRLEASPLAGLGVRPSPAAPAPVPPQPRAGWFGSYRSARSWAVGIGLSVACILVAIGVSLAFRTGPNGVSPAAGDRGADPPKISSDELIRLRKIREAKKAQEEKEHLRREQEALKKGPQ